ncbi:unnamed protein product [Rhizopus microsporus]
MQHTLFTIYRYTANRKKNIHHQDILQQFMSEQHIFINTSNTLLVHLPSPHHHHHNHHQYKLKNKKTPIKDIQQPLSISKTPFDVALDNVLFISTLEGCWTRTMPSPVQMKRQVSLTHTPNYVPMIVPRRHSYPEHDLPSRHNQQQQQPVIDSRRTSFQSEDSSTELVRRFSSESTQSTLASSVSSVESEKQCELVKKSITEPSDHGDVDIPVWADPIKVKENPTRYEHTVSQLNEMHIPFDSALPLAVPCTFYFTDNSSKQADSYLDSVKSLFDCDTVWNFVCRWRLYKETCQKKPSQLALNQNIFCFVQGVKPMWEDPINKKGGRLNIQVNLKLLDEVFESILFAFVGAGLIMLGTVGVAVSKRYRGDRIELWLDESVTDDKIPELK